MTTPATAGSKLLPSHPPITLLTRLLIGARLSVRPTLWFRTERRISKTKLFVVCPKKTVRQHFTLQYYQWRNGSIERPWKEVLLAARALLSKLKLPTTQQPAIVPLIKSAINNSPYPQHNNMPHHTTFTGDPTSMTPNVFLISSSGTFLDVLAAQRERCFNTHKLIHLINEFQSVVNSSL